MAGNNRVDTGALPGPSLAPTPTPSPTPTATPGWQHVTYTYGDPAHAHAVTALSTGESYQYDANGNMTTRVEGGQTYAQTFDAENRLVAVAVGGQTAQFVYDGDGTLVKKIRPDGTATVYIGAIYEVELSAGGAQTGATSYYALPGATVVRVDGVVSYVLTDHLGSARVVLDSTGAAVGELRYYPFGKTRAATGTWLTDRLFTGQRQDSMLKLPNQAAGQAILRVTEDTPSPLPTVRERAPGPIHHLPRPAMRATIAASDQLAERPGDPSI